VQKTWVETTVEKAITEKVTKQGANLQRTSSLLTPTETRTPGRMATVQPNLRGGGEHKRKRFSFGETKTLAEGDFKRKGSTLFNRT